LFWDRNRSNTACRIKENETTAPPPERARRGRQTVQWPFQSIATETEISSPTTTAYGRRATWQPKRCVRDGDDESIARDIIPDYVINYIRGETPETVARRKKNGGKLGERGIDITHQHQHHASRAAAFEGFYDGESSRAGASSTDEEQHILSGSREKDTRGWKRFSVGWRAGVALNALLSLLILVAAFVCVVLAIAKNSLSDGPSAIFSGSCLTASAIDLSLHVVVNIFAVVLIAGANYIFQVLSSPTRSEVAVAHDKKKWLDVGVQSVRNFGHIQASRVFVTLVILVAAVASQIV
jgi:hypothetical protein